MKSPVEIESVLGEFGLSEPQTRVYLAALELGSRPASVLAQRAHLKRGHTYNVLAELAERGLIQEFVRRGVRNFAAGSPLVLLSLAEAQESVATKARERVQSIVPQLEKLRSPLVHPPKLRFYPGLAGVKQVFDESIRTPKEAIYAVADAGFSLEAESKELSEFIVAYIPRRIKKGCWYYGICNKSASTDRIMASERGQKRKVKMMKGIPLPIELLIFGSKVGLVKLSSPMFGLIIEDQVIADTAKAMHQAVFRVMPAYR